MANFLDDTFTGTPGADLSAHTPDAAGGAWSADLFFGSNHIVIDGAGTSCRPGTGSFVPIHYVNAATPPSADYSVIGYFQYKSNEWFYVTGRFVQADGVAYRAGYNNSGQWELGKTTAAGPSGQIGTPVSAGSLVVNQVYKVELRMTGSTIEFYLDDAPIVTVSDTSITATGKAGIFFSSSAANDSTDALLNRITAAPATLGPATGYTATPDRTTVAASGNVVITLAPDGTTTDDVTLDDGGAGGSFSPAATVTLADNTPIDVTYTAPASLGSVTISFTNSGSLADPSDILLAVADLITAVFNGDSQFAGGQRWWLAFRAALNPELFYTPDANNVSQSGRKITDAGSGGVIDPASAIPSTGPCVVVTGLGINDVVQDGVLSGATLFSRATTYATYVHSLNPAAEVYWVLHGSIDVVGGPHSLVSGQLNAVLDDFRDLMYAGHRGIGVAAILPLRDSYVGPDGSEATTTDDLLHYKGAVLDTLGPMTAGMVISYRRTQAAGGDFPAEADVRLGVTYDDGALTGTLVAGSSGVSRGRLVNAGGV